MLLWWRLLFLIDSCFLVNVQVVFQRQVLFLSDISAIQYDNKYEYRKAEKTNIPAYTDEFYLKIYLGASNQESLSSIPFFQLDELFQSKDYRYQTGWVKFSDLKKIDFNNQDDLFFAVLPDSFKIEL